jgi:glucosamine-6-phosphate deaminase
LSERTKTDVSPLLIPKDAVGIGSQIPLETVPDPAALSERFANDLMAEYLNSKGSGRKKVVFILPVGPVGQFERWADRCNAERISLRDLVVINMDEYLNANATDFISIDDPLSFRRHMDRQFYNRLDPELAPPVDARHFPHPLRPEETGELIAAHGGVDVCFGGVGITGHLAFNDPPEPGQPMGLDEFANLPTRIVELSRETCLINSVTVCRGNLARIPRKAITVGMREILGSRRVRIYMNREWQCAIVRQLLHGPVTPDVPASLLQRHADARVVSADLVMEIPEPTLA